MSLGEVHISSLVVQAFPEHLEQVKAAIEAIDSAEIYGADKNGKIIVVLETENQGFVTDIIEKINNLPNTLSTALIYHQIETDLDQLDETILNTKSEGDV
ncbi:chaperone NapD [Vibrio sp. SS-MA-C1-2]|uniref:chaperone NapD n=1 Tax=Vibrio sp. SS-MA-C1-2 TaxID=2908646 RepID=UPI001F1C57C8|nr:chaperone NapD [Vibrio sp. SS-MA-C1-2]UJF16921.1 chaperone NapD [Vibrio sp. SS-MA-C1-2]